MSPHQLAVECENAYDARDRESLQRCLARLVVLAELHRRAWTGITEIAQRDPQPIDPSDPA
jgi:hypothetical protein